MTTTPERTATLTSLVAAEIRATMGRLDVRQSELARRMGETDQWLSMRLKGRTPIDVNELNRIAKALGVGVHQLLPPPDVAATAVTRSVIGDYLPLPVRRGESTLPALPTQRNRPPARRDSTRPSGERRTARVARQGHGERG